MILSTSYKSNQFLWLVFKVLIAFACLYFVADRLTHNSELSFSYFLSNLNDFDLFSLKKISFLLFLSIFNWFFEIWKWKVLASKIHTISWSESYKQSLSSLSFSLLTPNRIGEYGAKAYFFSKKDWKKVLVLNALGNGYQLLATFVFGMVGIVTFWNQLSDLIFTPNFTIPILIGFLCIILFSFTWTRKQFQKLTSFLQNFSLSFHLTIGSLSFIRYVIFSHQFYLILNWIQPEISYFNCISAIFLIYFISSCIPMLSLLDIVVKSSVSIWVLSWLQIDASVALTTIVLMWIFNFALPAILGSFTILRLQSKWN